MLNYGAGILIGLIVMLLISLNLIKRSVIFGILFSGIFIFLLWYHGNNYLQALALAH